MSHNNILGFGPILNGKMLNMNMASPCHASSGNLKQKRSLKIREISLSLVCFPQQIVGGSKPSRLKTVTLDIVAIVIMGMESVRISAEPRNEASKLQTKVCKLQICLVSSLYYSQATASRSQGLHPWTQEMRKTLIVL